MIGPFTAPTPIREGDAFHLEMIKQALLLSFRDHANAQRLLHLAEGYRCGVDASEIMERIEAGEVSKPSRTEGGTR